jgi:hypothetical protein
VIAVGAAAWSTPTPQLLRLTSFPVDVAAPGEFLKSALYGGGYGWASGTSVAAPLVSATASLILGSGAEQWSPWRLKQRILSTSDLWIEPDGNDNVRFGLLNVERAVRFLNEFRIEWFLGKAVQCHGRIRTEDLDQTISVHGIGGASFHLRDVRRMSQNEDGTFTILYEKASNKPATLEPLLGVLQKNIFTGDVPDVVFQISDSHGTCPAGSEFHLNQITDLVNGIY